MTLWLRLLFAAFSIKKTAHTDPNEADLPSAIHQTSCIKSHDCTTAKTFAPSAHT